MIEGDSSPKSGLNREEPLAISSFYKMLSIPLNQDLAFGLAQDVVLLPEALYVIAWVLQK